MKRVALIFATDSEGKLLLGKRRDNGRWTLPGGHLKDDEEPEAGAARELKEETGLDPLDDFMELMDERELNGVKFYTFGCGVDGTPSGKKDPDQECGVWAYFDVSKGVPKEVADNLQGPKDKDDNIVTDHFGLAKMQRIPGFAKLGIDDRREIPIITGPQQTGYKMKQIGWGIHEGWETPKSKWKQQEQKAQALGIGIDAVHNAGGAVVTVPEHEGQPSQPTVGFVHSNENSEYLHPHRRLTNTTDLATKLHEDFHNMMRRVQMKYGAQARYNLAHNLWHSFPHIDHPAAHTFSNNFNSYMDNDNPFKNEEHIAILHNYMNDAAERNKYHQTYGHSDARRQIANIQVKKAMAHMIDMAKNHVDESWMKQKLYGPGTENRYGRKETPKFTAPPPAAKPQPANPAQRKPSKRAPVKPKQLDLFKAEDDEVMRMLALPNADERRMALKLGTVNDKHLLRAFHDADPEIRYAALKHPAMSHESLMGLMHQPQSDSLQLLGMSHPLFDREHLRALYDHHARSQNMSPAIRDAIVAHDKLYPELIEKMHQDGHATRALINRADTPEHVLRETIEQHFTPGHDTKGPHRQLVIAALKHANAPHDLVERAMREGDDGLKLAAAVSPGMPQDLAEDILRQGSIKAGNPMVRAALVGSPFATARHLDLGVDDMHPLVRAAVFKTKSPLLNEKHVDRAIERGHPHDIVVALKSKAANQDHLAKLAQHKDPAISTLYTQYLNKTALKKWESGVADWKQNNSLIKSNLTNEDTGSDIVRDMLGYNHHLMSTFDAAKFLIAGHAPTLQQTRKALWDHDGDAEKAALAAHGLDVSEGNLRALRAVRDLRQHKKGEAEPVTVQSVTAGVPEAQKAAEAIENAFKDRFVFPVKLGGKHSDGTLLARDTKGGGTYLLKPGSGGLSPAAGDHDDPVSQSRREAVFWHVADDWGLGNYLPETNLVIIDGHEYACMELLPWKYKTLDDLQKKEKFQATRILQPYLQSGVLHKWAILDFILGNPDRHANNVMVDASGDTPHADVKLIDHGSALAGDNFDPANDQNSFVPFYLRAWVIGPYNTLSVEQKLKVMPRVDDHVADELHQWVSELHAHELQAQLLRYGVDPEPALARLAKLKVLMSEQPIDLAINKLWVTT